MICKILNSELISLILYDLRLISAFSQSSYFRSEVYNSVFSFNKNIPDILLCISSLKNYCENGSRTTERKQTPSLNI